uniref:Putative salivary kunitz domain protein n=1 Tax=Ixodes ricinus TaxID=34613 RepID=A0A0K8RLF4_IXORI
MQRNILWIFVVAAFGVCHSDERTYQDSGEDSSSMTVKSRCDGPPDTSRGWALTRGWFYDQSRDQCRFFRFPDPYFDHKKNKFQTVTECRRICRGTVPLGCFKEPPHIKRTRGLPMITYNSTQGACIEIAVKVGEHGPNIFKRTNECINKCRDPEYGQCAPSAVENCGRSTGYRYNVDTQTCETAPASKCGPFVSLEACYERCARYVKKKCNIPLLTSKYCDTVEARYWYDSRTKKCEQIMGCSDDVTNFPTAKECWETCSSKEESRCLQPPDLGRLGFGRKRYYYNITANTCLTTTQVALWQNTKKKNNFGSLTECENTCKPKHRDVKEL